MPETTPKRKVSREARMAAAIVKITELAPAERRAFDNLGRGGAEAIVAAHKALDRCDVDDRPRVLAIVTD